MDCYGIRRVSPYLGVIQVIDVGDARAYSTDGLRWRFRALADEDRLSGALPGDGMPLSRALRERPPLPFPMGDRFELWLLSKATGGPLALLRTARWPQEMGEVDTPYWRPFVLEEPAGTTASLAPGHHWDALLSLIDGASSPMPSAQWFERHEDGSGTRLGGLRVAAGSVGRALAPHAFPELLADEDWANAAQRQLVEDFHDSQAALLLAHQNLTRKTRLRLEQAARRRPGKLLGAYRMLPEVIDREGMTAALVAARLMRANDGR